MRSRNFLGNVPLRNMMFGCLVLAGLCGPASRGRAQEAGHEGPPGAYELTSMECGELNDEAALAPLRTSHVAGEDLDLLCKVKVTVPHKGTPKAHTLTLSVFQGKKTSYQQVRDVRLLTPGTRIILFVVPAEKLPSEGGPVHVRAELSRPAAKPGFHEVVYDLNAED